VLDHRAGAHTLPHAAWKPARMDSTPADSLSELLRQKVILHWLVVGLARFDGHPLSGALPRGGCPSWRPWNPSNLARVGRSPPEFEAEIVELCQRGDRWIGRVARDFDLTETAVREWVRQAERDAVRVATAG
jgi:hypothetical protein